MLAFVTHYISQNLATICDILDEYQLFSVYLLVNTPTQLEY